LNLYFENWYVQMIMHENFENAENSEFQCALFHYSTQNLI
jgi:hypothetical protein